MESIDFDSDCGVVGICELVVSLFFVEFSLLSGITVFEA